MKTYGLCPAAVIRFSKGYVSQRSKAKAKIYNECEIETLPGAAL